MCDQNHNLVSHCFVDALIKDSLGNFWVNSTKWIIQQYDVSLGVHCSCQTDTCLLPTRNIDTSLANLRVRAIAEDF